MIISVLKKHIINNLKRFIQNEQGTTVIEYSLIGTLVSIAVVAIVTTLGENLDELFFDKLNEMW